MISNWKLPLFSWFINKYFIAFPVKPKHLYKHDKCYANVVCLLGLLCQRFRPWISIKLALFSRVRVVNSQLLLHLKVSSSNCFLEKQAVTAFYLYMAVGSRSPKRRTTVGHWGVSNLLFAQDNKERLNFTPLWNNLMSCTFTSLISLLK